MINFFKNIFTPNNSKKVETKKSEIDIYKIYFDRNKRSFLELKITKDFSCQDVHSQYHNEILAELMKNNSIQNNSKFINANDFSFMIIDDDNPYSEIKLKMKDFPVKFLKKKTINIYYLNITNKKENGEDDRDYKIGELSDCTTINNINNTPTTISMVPNNEECIREGELLKYSFKHKTFDKRNLVLDKEKLIITKPKNKGINIILYYRNNYIIII